MSIIGKLKGLIFGAKPEPKFSDSDILAAKQRAETLAREFNESFNIAKKSKNRGEREYRIKIARECLIELKKLTIKFPFLSLQNLQSVEADIAKVEVETRALPYGEVVDTSIKDIPDKVRPEGSGQDRQRLSEIEEQTILMCIQSCFRVVNESIEIARKSKNLDTKISRLRVARDSLKEAQRKASQFSLEVGGFIEAEAEINRIDEAIKAGTPTEIAGMPHIEINDAFASPARGLLKEATALKKEKKFAQACSKLREAYSAEGSENLMIEDRLRLPMYLQLAGQNDEGWKELNRLDAKHTDQFSEARILAQMSIFLKKEKNEAASNPVRIILREKNREQDRISAMQKNRESNIATLKANADITPTVRWLSVLDSDTCLRCGVRDGLEWDTLTQEPIGHDIPYADPPLHINCRCRLNPVTAIDKFVEGQRASMFGPVDRKVTFSDFLERQTPEFQERVLGKGRAELYRANKLTLRNLVDKTGRELTLTELRNVFGG